MKKNNDRDCCVPLFRKTIRIMRITVLFSLAVACCISASTYAQDYKVSINKQNSSIIEILKEIEKNSEFTFFFNDNHVNVNRKVSVKAKDVSLDNGSSYSVPNPDTASRLLRFRRSCAPDHKIGRAHV